jgi:hypothetical protein
MKTLVDNPEEGLLSLMGETITVLCCRYIYTGKLIGVNDTCIKLEDPKIVFNTGSLSDKEWKEAEALPHKHFYVGTESIESFGIMK